MKKIRKFPLLQILPRMNITLHRPRQKKKIQTKKQVKKAIQQDLSDYLERNLDLTITLIQEVVISRALSHLVEQILTLALDQSLLRDENTILKKIHRRELNYSIIIIIIIFNILLAIY